MSKNKASLEHYYRSNCDIPNCILREEKHLRIDKVY